MNRWIGGNRYLSASEQQNNATIIWTLLGRQGWSVNAVAALLGNMEAESTINPAIWENLNSGNLDGGFGLVQWTPATNYINWAGADWDSNYDKQIARILYELENGLQYYPTARFPETFREFSTSEKSPYYLGGAFVINYERPADQSESVIDYRGRLAEKWFEYITTLPAPDALKIPVWLLFKLSEKGGLRFV